MNDLNLTDAAVEYLKEMRALSTDREGRPILVGLTFEESKWLLDYRYDRFSPTDEDDDRALELQERHEMERFKVLGAEHILRTENPTRN